MRYRLVVEGTWPAPNDTAENDITHCKRTYISPRTAALAIGTVGQQRLELLDDDGSVLASWSEER